MPRPSQQGHARLSQRSHTNDPHTAFAAPTNLRAPRRRADGDYYLQRNERMETGAASAEERDSSRRLAPPGVTPRPPAPTGRPAEATAPAPAELATAGRKLRTGDVVKGATWTLTLAGGYRGRRLRCSGGRLSLAEARKVAKHARRGKACGARVMGEVATYRSPPTPKDPADRTRGVLTWTLTLLGRSLGIRVLVRELGRHGLLPAGAKRGRRGAKA